MEFNIETTLAEIREQERLEAATAETERAEREEAQRQAQQGQRLASLKTDLAKAENKQNTQGLAERIYIKRQLQELEQSK